MESSKTSSVMDLEQKNQTLQHNNAVGDGVSAATTIPLAKKKKIVKKSKAASDAASSNSDKLTSVVEGGANAVVKKKKKMVVKKNNQSSLDGSTKADVPDHSPVMKKIKKRKVKTPDVNSDVNSKQASSSTDGVTSIYHHHVDNTNLPSKVSKINESQTPSSSLVLLPASSTSQSVTPSSSHSTESNNFVKPFSSHTSTLSVDAPSNVMVEKKNVSDSDFYGFEDDDVMDVERAKSPPYQPSSPSYKPMHNDSESINVNLVELQSLLDIPQTSVSSDTSLAHPIKSDAVIAKRKSIDSDNTVDISAQLGKIDCSSIVSTHYRMEEPVQDTDSYSRTENDDTDNFSRRDTSPFHRGGRYSYSPVHDSRKDDYGYDDNNDEMVVDDDMNHNEREHNTDEKSHPTNRSDQDNDSDITSSSSGVRGKKHVHDDENNKKNGNNAYANRGVFLDFMSGRSSQGDIIGINGLVIPLNYTPSQVLSYIAKYIEIKDVSTICIMEYCNMAAVGHRGAGKGDLVRKLLRHVGLRRVLVLIKSADNFTIRNIDAFFTSTSSQIFNKTIVCHRQSDGDQNFADLTIRQQFMHNGTAQSYFVELKFLAGFGFEQDDFSNMNDRFTSILNAPIESNHYGSIPYDDIFNFMKSTLSFPSHLYSFDFFNDSSSSHHHADHKSSSSSSNHHADGQRQYQNKRKGDYHGSYRRFGKEENFNRSRAGERSVDAPSFQSTSSSSHVVTQSSGIMDQSSGDNSNQHLAEYSTPNAQRRFNQHTSHSHFKKSHSNSGATGQYKSLPPYDPSSSAIDSDTTVVFVDRPFKKNDSTSFKQPYHKKHFSHQQRHPRNNNNNNNNNNDHYQRHHSDNSDVY